MKKYIVTQEQTKYVEVVVEAKNKREAEEKAFENEGEVLEDEYFLPSTEWKTTSIKEVKKDKTD